MSESITIIQLLLSYVGIFLIAGSNWVKYEVVTEKREDPKGKKAFWSKGLEYAGIILLMFLLLRT